MILITGSGGLIGSEAVAFFAKLGMPVHGVDNDMRQYFFGKGSSTAWRVQELESKFPNYRHHNLDIRNAEAVDALVRSLGSELKYVIHAAAQPSHDWAAKEPLTDFAVNAVASQYLLEAVRLHAPQAAFAFLSTNKVYGDAPNRLPLIEQESRWELDPSHPYAARGIDETLSIDQSTHSVFGASKLAADVMVQEYGRYFGLNTAVFRGGCLTGSGHSGSELHGFLAYLMQCIATDQPYTVFGYKGKQVRDNIHSSDLVNAIWHFFQAPTSGRAYNIGGSRFSNCSMLEAIAIGEKTIGRSLRWTYSDTNRIGDHIWWVSDISRFQADYPEFRLKFDIPAIIEELYENGVHRWQGSRLMLDGGKRNILGIGVNVIDYDAAVARIIDAAQQRQPFSVTALAVHGVMTGVQDSGHRQRLNAFDLVVPDGQPVRWALGWLHGQRLQSRVYGPELMKRICAAAATAGVPIYLYGSRPPVLAALSENLTAEFAGLQVAGMAPSRFKQASPEENTSIINGITATAPGIVFVGLGCPRQEVFAYENVAALNCPVIAVGAAFDFHAGLLPQAPQWMMDRGLEWLFRLGSEPRRLWRRYLYLNPLYLMHVARQLVRPQHYAPLAPQAPAQRQNYV